MHNTTQQNEDFRRAFDATNARWKAQQTMINEEKQTLQIVYEQLNGLVYDIENYNDLEHLGTTIIDCVKRLETIGVNNE
jgi:hypothetical protein